MNISDIELMDKYRNLQKDVQSVKELKRCCIDAKENLFSVNTVLQALRRKRIAELNIIYPISQVSSLVSLVILFSAVITHSANIPFPLEVVRFVVMLYSSPVGLLVGSTGGEGTTISDQTRLFMSARLVRKVE